MRASQAPAVRELAAAKRLTEGVAASLSGIPPDKDACYTFMTHGPKVLHSGAFPLNWGCTGEKAGCAAGM